MPVASVSLLMSPYDQLQARLASEPHTWLITGVAGFIGSNLLEALLQLDQAVVGLDNFATGYQHNLDEVQPSPEIILRPKSGVWVKLWKRELMAAST